MRLTPLKLRLWRAVEAQHRVSTLRLVDHDPANQELLESLLEESKPLLPPATKRLHYLLATPFRYPSPQGSRFRAPHDPGIFYGAAEQRTACAELGFWRWRFLRASHGLHQLAATAHTLFAAGVQADAVDLRLPPYRRLQAQWMHPDNYLPTQAFAREARSASAALILYASVRDPQHALCAAVLSPQAFRPSRPLTQQTWFLSVTADSALWTREKVEFAFRFAP